jgi:hypothetical protein
MTSQNSQPEIYDPKTLAVMDQAFAAIWNVVRAEDPFCNYANDSELRIAIGRKLLTLVADGVTDARRLRHLTVDSLLLPGHWRSVVPHATEKGAAHGAFHPQSKY